MTKDVERATEALSHLAAQRDAAVPLVASPGEVQIEKHEAGVIVRPPTAVLSLLGAHDPDASVTDIIKHLVDENRRLERKLDDFKQTSWTLGQALTSVTRAALSGIVRKHDVEDAILITRQEVLKSHSYTVTIAPVPVTNDMVLRVRDRSHLQAPGNEAV